MEFSVARIVTFDGDKEEALCGRSSLPGINDDIDISRGDICCWRQTRRWHLARHAAIDVVWMAEQRRWRRAKATTGVKLAGKKTRARIVRLFAIRLISTPDPTRRREPAVKRYWSGRDDIR